MRFRNSNFIEAKGNKGFDYEFDGSQFVRLRGNLAHVVDDRGWAFWLFVAGSVAGIVTLIIWFVS